LADELPALLETLRGLETSASEWRWLATQTADWSSVPPPVPPEDLPSHIGRYRVLARVGAGGMGTVYRAEDPQLQRTVATKVPRREGRGDPPRTVERFLREARAAARVHHPHLCPIHDVGETGGLPYLVMTYIEGASLAKRLEQGPRLADR